MRFNGTLGEDPILSIDLGEAYCDGFQTSYSENEINDGWGYDSVNAMVKHWPGGGSGESGRDTHYAYGKFAVYPGNNFDEHLIPFTEGAFKLKGKTKKASAVMPYYTISYNQDKKNGENIGNSYNKYIINDLLRDEYKYDGVICTDWLITKNNHVVDAFISGKCWGVETLSEDERHYKALMAGVDQFEGNNEVQPILNAYKMGVKEHGEEFMRARFEKSAVRLLLNIFRTGLFENPYVDVIITDFGAQTQAIMDIISGNVNPSGLLPFNMPANMETVEAQCEDVPHDMKCYKDELGNVYKFAYGLDFNGVINDNRVAKYKIK